MYQQLLINGKLLLYWEAAVGVGGPADFICCTAYTSLETAANAASSTQLTSDHTTSDRIYGLGLNSMQ